MSSASFSVLIALCALAGMLGGRIAIDIGNEPPSWGVVFGFVAVVAALTTVAVTSC